MTFFINDMNILVERITYQEIKNLIIPLEKCNIYLVGSRAKQTHNIHSDYDYILLIDQNFTIDKLQNLSQSITKRLYKKNTSVKVFDLLAFSNLYENDFFRFLEYKQALLKSQNKLPPLFEKFSSNPKNENLLDSFIHSIIVQMSWSLAIITHYKNQEDILNKFQRRFKINFSFLNQSLEGIEYEENFLISKIEKHPLYLKLTNPNQGDFSDFLERYFNLFLHEKINKFDLYERTFIEKKDIVKNLLIKFDLNTILNDKY